jgi:hypothetical protein
VCITNIEEHTQMQRYRFPIAVATTSLALVLIAIGVGGLVVGNALASSPLGAFAGGGPWHNGGGWNPAASLPPELAGLADVPADQRFSHFRGARVQLTDKNNQPLTIEVTPGTVTAVSQNSLTMNTNEGASRTFTLNDQTKTHGETAAQNDKVAVVTINNNATASAVMVMDGAGFGPHGRWGR